MRPPRSFPAWTYGWTTPIRDLAYLPFLEEALGGKWVEVSVHAKGKTVGACVRAIAAGL